MTCIVGVAERGHVWIGADSAGADDGWGLRVRADRKVFRNGPFVMGFTYSFRMGQLLRYAFKAPEFSRGADVNAWMSTKFIDAVRRCLKKGGFARSDCDREEGGTFLVGYRGRLFEVHGDYQVAVPMDCDGVQIAAVGCGGQIALGALHVLDGKRPAPERIRRSLDAAQSYSAGVRGPFVVEELKPRRA